MPTQFELVLDNRNTLVPARIVWRRDRELGAAFPRPQFMRELHEATRASDVSAKSTTSGNRLH